MPFRRRRRRTKKQKETLPGAMAIMVNDGARSRWYGSRGTRRLTMVLRVLSAKIERDLTVSRGGDYALSFCKREDEVRSPHWDT